MAGEPLSLAELKEWYAAFNTVINAYSGGTIAPLTNPADGSKVLPEHINNAYDKITAMKNDEYLGTQESYYSTFTKVAQGEEITRPDAVPITDTMKKITAIKCRNTTTFTNGYHSHTDKSHTAKSHGTNSHGTQGNGTKSNGNHGNLNNANGCYNNKASGCSGNWCNSSLCYWGAKGDGAYSQGTKGHGALSHTLNTHGVNDHTAKSNESQKDILNVHTTLNKN